MTCEGQNVFITLVNLAEYYKFITDDEGNLIRHIFESNVRDYQGRTNVNNDIFNTLVAPEGEDFWWLNNGVTIIASEATIPRSREIMFSNPEIVNGLQTSSEIYKYFTQNLKQIETESRNILVRIIVPETEEARDKIIRATNSQTPIPKASLRATDNIHRQIEEFLKPRGLFYDRRKNFYKNEGKNNKDIISIPFMAQCLMSLLIQKPDFARARPSTLLEDDDAYNRLYHQDNDIHIYYIAASSGRQIFLILKNSGKYNSSEISNILFYVLYAYCVIKLSNIYPSAKLLLRLNPNEIDGLEVINIANLVYDVYQSLGGSDKVAKGTKFPEMLKERLRDKIEN